MSKSIPEELMNLKKRIEKEDKEQKRREEARKLEEERKKNEEPEFSLDDLPQISPDYQHPEPFKIPGWVKGTAGLVGIALVLGVFSFFAVKDQKRTHTKAPISTSRVAEPPVVQEPGKPRISKQPLEKKVGYLTVYPNPKDATVKVMDIKPRYRPGIELTVGSHQISVEKQGFITRNQDIYIPKGEHVRKPISLKKYVAPKIPKKKYLPSWVTKVAFNGPWAERETVEQYLANPVGWDVRTYTNTWITITQLKPRKYYNIHQWDPKPLEVFYNGNLVKSYYYSSGYIAASPKMDKIFFMEQTRESFDYFANKFWTGNFRRRKTKRAEELKVLYPNGSTSHVSYNACGHIKIRWVDNNTINIGTGRCSSQWYEKKGRVSVR